MQGWKIDNVIRDINDNYSGRGGGVSAVDIDEDGSLKSGDSEGSDKTTKSIPYTFNDVKLGTTYFVDGADLNVFPSSSYSFVMSSHNLEHHTNALKAVFEWDRVLEPGGYMFLNLPDKDFTFDGNREETNFLHLLNDYLDPTEKRLVEDVIENILRMTDYSKVNPSEPAKVEADHRRRAEEKAEFWMDGGPFHWHVFNLKVLEEIFFCLGYKILALQKMGNFHLMAVARKPETIDIEHKNE